LMPASVPSLPGAVHMCVGISRHLPCVAACNGVAPCLEFSALQLRQSGPWAKFALQHQFFVARFAVGVLSLAGTGGRFKMIDAVVELVTYPLCCPHFCPHVLMHWSWSAGSSICWWQVQTIRSCVCQNELMFMRHGCGRRRNAACSPSA
jgi:hypothetical protein